LYAFLFSPMRSICLAHLLLLDLIILVFFEECNFEAPQYLAFSTFTSRQSSLLASDKVSMFFFVVFVLSPNKLSSAAYTRSWCVPSSSIYFTGL
jgi:hypothetical protein